MLKRFNQFITEKLSDDTKSNYFKKLLALGHKNRIESGLDKSKTFLFKLGENYFKDGDKYFGRNKNINVKYIGLEVFSSKIPRDATSDTYQIILGKNPITKSGSIISYQLRELTHGKSIITFRFNFLPEKINNYIHTKHTHISLYQSAYITLNLSVVCDDSTASGIMNKYKFKEGEKNDFSKINPDYMFLDVTNKLTNRKDALEFKNFLENEIINNDVSREFFINESSPEILKAIADNIHAFPISYMYDQT